MNPAELIAALELVEAAVTAAPEFAADIQEIFAGGIPTPADFAALRAKISAETYGQFVPASQLPQSETNT